MLILKFVTDPFSHLRFLMKGIKGGIENQSIFRLEDAPFIVYWN